MRNKGSTTVRGMADVRVFAFGSGSLATFGCRRMLDDVGKELVVVFQLGVVATRGTIHGDHSSLDIHFPNDFRQAEVRPETDACTSQ